MPSFDVVSKLDLQEIDNAVNQARKELLTRFDFQGTKTEILLAADGQTITLKSINEDRVDVAYELLLAKLAKRGVPLRAVQPGKFQPVGMGLTQKPITFQQGISVEKSKELIALLKESKLKVSAAIQADQLRVTGKNKDDLQKAMALFRAKADALKLDMQFTNFRD
jgi:uncharacterized protein YajQ (UPF0234 family)